MKAGDETGAAILVQTIFSKDGHLQGLLGEQALKSPEAAVAFLKPYYMAALALTVRAKAEPGELVEPAVVLAFVSWA